MRNDLVKPCDNCPFRNNGNGVKLEVERVRELAENVGVRGHGFVCHKTVDRDDDYLTPRERPWNKKEALCAGSLAFARNVGDGTTQVVIRIRLDNDPKKLANLEASRDQVYRTTEEWLKGGVL